MYCRPRHHLEEDFTSFDLPRSRLALFRKPFSTLVLHTANRMATIGSPSFCPIFKLPAELRTRIWEWVVVFEDPVTILNYGYPEPFDMASYSLPPSRPQIHDNNLKIPKSSLAIAFTCRQAYKEVTPLYYSQNSFQALFVVSPDNEAIITLMRHFVEAIGPQNTNCVQNMALLPEWFACGFNTLAMTDSSQPEILARRFPKNFLRDIQELFSGTPAVVVGCLLENYYTMSTELLSLDSDGSFDYPTADGLDLRW